MYALGVDLGTTFTSAAVWRDGRPDVVSLGSRMAALPSVVYFGTDGVTLVGEAAERHTMAEPDRVAREFKRRLGDPTPLMLGGSPFSAEALTAKLLRAVLDTVRGREGGEPDAVVLCHPANWGPYKTELLQQAVRLAGLENLQVTLITEPEAAAVLYAHKQQVPVGAAVAVYDLGGGTFDAAVIRKTATGFEMLGRPEGIERLGGIDFDAAVFAHVTRSLSGAFDDLDEDDPATLGAVARLREECTRAKEALSEDTDVSIPVLLPALTTEVRLTRSELESMIRPALSDTVDALRRALASADVAVEDLHSVLLVGGSSRIPLVAQLVGAELGRPVAVDADPKQAIALGAAWAASSLLPGAAAAAVPSAGPSAAPAAPTPQAPAAPTPQAPPVGFVAAAAVPLLVAASSAPPVPPTPPVQLPPGQPEQPAVVRSARSAAFAAGRPGSRDGGSHGPGSRSDLDDTAAQRPVAARSAASGKGLRRGLIGGGVAVLVLAGGVAAAAAILQPGGGEGTGAATDDSQSVAAASTAAPSTVATTAVPTTTTPAISTDPATSRPSVAAKDSDKDGLSDSREATLGTNPSKADTDGDKLPDGTEVEIGSDPLKPDTDGDMLTDVDEVSLYETDPTTIDTDGDRLNDYDEIFVYLSDPLDTDTNKDGIDDGDAIDLGMDPSFIEPTTTPSTIPTTTTGGGSVPKPTLGSATLIAP